MIVQERLDEIRLNHRTGYEINRETTAGIVFELLDEIKRLKEGRFTLEELQNLCHNLTDSDYKAFCDGCDVEQKKLFGKCRTEEIAGDFEGLVKK